MCEPRANVDTEVVAWPDGPTGTVASTEAPSAKVTVPDGVGTEDGPLTVAVRATD